MNLKTFLSILPAVGIMFVVTGCDTAKQELGLTRRTPDEFSVVRRAPLEIPAQLSTDSSALPTPQPGAPRPQEKTAIDQARSAVSGTDILSDTGSQNAGSTAAESALLAKIGDSDPEIRVKLNAESAQVTDDARPVAKRLLNIGSDERPAVIVDAPAEAERIINNKKAGAPVTKGDTPIIDD